MTRPHTLVALALVCLVSACARGGGPMPRSASPPREAVTLHWLGGPTALLSRGDFRVLTDPMLGPRGERAFVLPKHPSSGVLEAPIARYTAPPAVALRGLDAILISHTHNDHFDAEARATLPKDLPVVVAAAGAESVRASGFLDVRPLDWGEQLTLQADGTTMVITAVPAHHAHDATLDESLGRGNGYVLELRDARGSYRIYWTGDAVLSPESETLAARHGPIDLLLPHLGGVGGDGGLGLRTMNAEEALGLVARVRPGRVVPIHHTTFAHYREPIDALMERAGESEHGPRFRFVREGEVVSLP